MNNSAEGEVELSIFGFFIILGVFLFLGYISTNITVTKIEFAITNGNLTVPSIYESAASRFSLWTQSYDSGYYNAYISSGNNTLIFIQKTGSLKKYVYLTEFVNCVNITVVNSNNGQFLNSKEVCKIK